MQKNLVTKAVGIIVILIFFLYGIFGIPKGLSGNAFKEALLSRINLGLDLKGGTYLILQVVVNEAVSSETDHTVEFLQEELKKANASFTDVSKPDEKNQPELIVAKGIPLDQALQTGYKSLDYMVTKQAAVLSYMDAFLYLGVLFLLCIPFVLMVKGNKGNKINPAEAMH